MTEEKFISIEYQKWISFYKPLEDKFNTLKKDYNDLQADKKILLYLSWWSYGRNDKREIGCIDVKALNVNESFKTFGIDLDKQIFKKVINDLVRDSYSNNERVFITRDDLENCEKRIKELKKVEQNLIREHNLRIEESKTIKKEREDLHKERAAMKWPRFFQWLIKVFSKKKHV